MEHNYNQTKQSFSLSSEQKIIGGIGLITFILLFGGVFLLSRQTENLEKSLQGDKVPIISGTHVQRGSVHSDYNSNPPTSGPHWGDNTAGPGIHEQEVQDELLVHSLEHGAVIVSYKADLSNEAVDVIKTAFDKASGKKILIPRKSLDVPVALTSWGRIEKIKTIPVTQISTVNALITHFIESNSDKAPEKAPI